MNTARLQRQVQSICISLLWSEVGLETQWWQIFCSFFLREARNLDLDMLSPHVQMHATDRNFKMIVYHSTLSGPKKVGSRVRSEGRCVRGFAGMDPGQRRLAWQSQMHDAVARGTRLDSPRPAPCPTEIQGRNSQSTQTGRKEEALRKLRLWNPSAQSGRGLGAHRGNNLASVCLCALL